MKKTRKSKNPCERYGIAITNYVLGEELGMPLEELMTHLRQCRKCLDEVIDWRETYAVMRMKEYESRPDARARMQQMFDDLKQQVFGTDTQCPARAGEQIFDTEWKIGSAAGMVYQYLEKTGKAATLDIFRHTKLNLRDVDWALGWLAKEKKICLSEEKQTTYAYLPR